MKPASLFLAALVLAGVGVLAWRQHRRAGERAEIKSSDAEARAGLRPDEVSVFAAPRLIAGMQQGMTVTQELFAQKRYAEAEALLAELVRAEPRIGANHYNLACSRALQGKADAALESLRAAVQHGFRDTAHIEADADLESLRERVEYQAILEEAHQPTAAEPAAQPAPRVIRDGVAFVGKDNTTVSMQFSALVAAFSLDPQDPRKTAPAVKGQGKAGDLVRQWQREGSAAGLLGVLYDNHDRDHSNLTARDFPQLSFLEYAPEARSEGLDLGLQARFLFNLPTLGNSSTAQTHGALWRSQARNAQTLPNALAVQLIGYLSNHLYVYPEHRDYDPGRDGAGGGWGDVFPANTPYCLVAQGSSGSDLPFVRALATTLAAFRPDTRERLTRAGLIAPTLQMLLRRCSVPTLDDYFTGRAHPIAFDAARLDLVRMVEMAHALAPGELPPVVRLAVKEEDALRPGVDYVDATPGEILFESACAVARVWHSAARTRRMVLNVERTTDPNERPLTYRWALLQGRPADVTIVPLTPNGSVAELRLAWHDRFPISADGKLASNRVDIGVFAHNGAHWSAPSFITFYCPDSEQRRYDTAGRLQSIEHRSAARGGHYADPLAHTPRDWRDDLHYDATGRLLGWTRTRGDAVEEFTADGLLVVEKDENARPIVARTVQYVTEPGGSEGPALRQIVTDLEHRYEYVSAEDRRGRAVENTGQR